MKLLPRQPASVQRTDYNGFAVSREAGRRGETALTRFMRRVRLTANSSRPYFTRFER